MPTGNEIANVGGGMGRALLRTEAAARIGTSERTLDRLIENGKLRAHRVSGRRVTIFEADLQEYLRSVASKPQEPLTTQEQA